MTKEQAKEILQGAIKKPNTKDGFLGQAIDMAIKALEQQPCDDCVSRAELKKWLDINFSFGGALRKLEMFDRIDKELPPVTPIQNWIPIVRRDLTQEEKESYYSLNGLEPEYMIENRMPDDGEEVLVSWGGNVLKDIFSHDYFDFENISVDEIEAWMPLPEPYKADKGGRI